MGDSVAAFNAHRGTFPRSFHKPAMDAIEHSFKTGSAGLIPGSCRQIVPSVKAPTSPPADHGGRETGGT
jgi:hypothetical protein